MKTLRRCPACGCAKLLRVSPIRADVMAQSVGFALTTFVGATRVHTHGEFEVHACTRCGLCEWHALELDPSILDDKRVTLIEPPDDEAAGPYR